LQARGFNDGRELITFGGYCVSDWTSGYVADVEYTMGYFTELNPVRLPLGLLNAGYAPPKIQNACELGFGLGMSIAMHAASQPHVKWFGDDFNPDHVLFARWLNDAAGADAVLTDESFEQFCSRDDLPMFDMIGLHGIWSWVTPQNRDIIIDFINRKLNVGGVVYCSYNVMPGWAAAAPIRELLAMHARMTGGKGHGSAQKMDAALNFVTGMFDQEPAFLAANPQAKAKFEQMKTMPRGYLSHEYMNTSWYPMYFNQIAEIFGEAKLEFACSAAYHDAVEELHYSPAQQAWLNEIEDEAFRETMRDFMRNTQFRKDYWVKGGLALPQGEQVERIRDLRLVAMNTRAAIELKINTTRGEINLLPDIYEPILDVLADYRIHTLRDVEIAVQDKGIQFGQILQAVMLMSGIGNIGFAQSEAEIYAARPRTRKMNTGILNRAEHQDGINYLASPVTGGSMALGRIDQLFTQAWMAGMNEPPRLADHAFTALESRGQRVVVDGKPAETPEQSREQLGRAVENFLSKILPVLEGLEIAVRGKVSPVARKGGRS